MEGSYPGKVVIFPQLHDLPLMGLDQLRVNYPEIGEKLREGDIWTMEAEIALIERFWEPEKIV